jgi:L-fuculose-phosphate aldolase
MNMASFDFDQFKKDLVDGVTNVADTVTSAAKETTGDVVRFKHFNETGKDLFASGYTTSHGGNLSESDGDSIWISRTGAMLGRISTSDVRKVFMSPTDLDAEASMELVVHRAIYQAWAARSKELGIPFGAKAIIHAHCKYTTYRSLISDAIEPVDSEGIMTLGESVPVIAAENVVASEEVAARMGELIAGGGFVGVVRGHGPFALADTLEDALRLISCLEYSSELLTIIEAGDKQVLR